MKKIITFICISLFCAFSISAQVRKESREKIKALKISYFTEHLGLTSNEAQKFWPIYNAYSDEQHNLRDAHKSELKNAIKNKGEIDSLSEKEAENLINFKLTTDRELYQSQKKFFNKVKEVISFKKIIKLQVAEMEFSRKLMKRYRHKKENSKNK